MAQFNANYGINAVLVEKQLGQSRPGSTTAVSAYSPSSDIVSAQILTVVIANTTGSAAAYRLFHDEDGTTYDQTTALAYDVSLAANSKEVINFDGLFMANSSGNFAVRTDTNDALTFTIYGREVETRRQ